MKEFLHTLNNFFSKFFKGELGKERFFLILLITVLVVIWFRKGLILASGESGLPFYNTSRFLELLKSDWTDAPLGSGGSIGYPAYPLYATTTFFQNLHIPSFIIQAVMFWIIFVVGTLAIFEIASLIRGNSRLTRVSSALFYIFNPIVHISVLHRFQYPLIFFYAFLPLAFLLYFKGLKTKNFIYLVLLGLGSVFFSFSFVGPAFLQLLFGVLGSFSFLHFLSNFRKNRDWFPIFYFLGFVVIFMLLNSWWLIPLFTSISVDLGSRGSVQYFRPSDNVITFKAISDQVESVLSVFRLFKSNDHPIDESVWAWVYRTFPFVILSFFSIVAFIISLFKKEKEFVYKFLILVSFIAMFWMKGTLRPLGGIALFIFEFFIFLHVLRNPFEKIGLILPFAMAIPIGFGIEIIVNFLSNNLKLSKKIVAPVILTLVLPVYMFPIVTGLAFTGGSPPANNPAIGQYVKVPDFYKDAREWLEKQEKPFRVLVLPINGEGMTYKWEYGFSGVELSNNLFNQPMVSLSTSNGSLPVIVDNIKQTLLNYPDKVWILAQFLNVKYIMVRDDIDYLFRGTEDPARILEYIRKYLFQNFSEVMHFGKLSFFELKSTDFRPMVYASTEPVYLFDPAGNSLGLMPFSNPKGNEVFIASSKSSVGDPYVNLARKTMINGVKIENVRVNLNDPIENLPFVSIYRDTPFYALVRLKEELQNQFQSEDNQLSFRINLLGKRLAELSHSPQNTLARQEYYQGFKSIISELTNSPSVDRVVAESLVNQRDALEKIKKRTTEIVLIEQIISDLNNLLIAIGARSVFPTEKDLIYRFYAPKDSQYEILVPRQNWSSYFEDDGIREIDIDGKIIKLDPINQKDDKDVFLLGTYNLSQGVHEVSIAKPKARNLISEILPEELELSSKDKKPLIRIIPVSDLDISYSYLLYFEYFEEKGNVPIVSLHSDVDFTDKNGEKIPRLGIALTRDNYDFGWKKYNGLFTPLPASSKYFIEIKIIPFGDCKAVVQRPYRRYCEDNSFNQRFLQDSSTKIRNLRIEKQFLNKVVLRGIESTHVNNVLPKISFEAISPARYRVKVENAQNSFFLMLSTSFDPRWNAYFVTPDGNDLLQSNNHFVANVYANGWYVEKLGNFEMFLEYYPESTFILGQRFGLVAVIIAILISGGYYIRKYIKQKNQAQN